MSLAPRGFGYDAACIMFVKGFCCEGGGEKVGNLKQPLLGVCRAVLLDAASPGKPFGLLSSLTLLSIVLLLRFSAYRVSSSSANPGCFPPAPLCRGWPRRSWMCRSPCASLQVLQRVFGRSQNLCWEFLYERGISQMNSLVHLFLLKEHISVPIDQG